MKVQKFADLLDCTTEESAVRDFLKGSEKPISLKKLGGYRAVYELKPEGVYVHLDYVDKKWCITAVQLLGKSQLGFRPYSGEIVAGLTIAATRSEVESLLGSPSSTGGSGRPGSYGIIDRIWRRWDYIDHALRFDFDDQSKIYVVSIQRITDVERFESSRKA